LYQVLSRNNRVAILESLILNSNHSRTSLSTQIAWFSRHGI